MVFGGLDLGGREGRGGWADLTVSCVLRHVLEEEGCGGFGGWRLGGERRVWEGI